MLWAVELIRAKVSWMSHDQLVEITMRASTLGLDRSMPA